MSREQNREVEPQEQWYVMRAYKSEKKAEELLEGESIDFINSFSGDNLNDISWWIQKHLGYAKRKAVDLLDVEFDLAGSAKNTVCSQIDCQALKKRRKKQKYAKQPLFFRAFAYFVYLYIIKLGFLDGKKGFMWDFLQGWWYRTLVDAKIFECKKACGNDREAIRSYIREKWGISI